MLLLFYLESHFQIQDVQILSCFISQDFHSSAFRHVIHFLVLFAEDLCVEFLLGFWFLEGKQQNVQLFQCQLLKRLSLFHCISFAPLSKINWLYLCVSISGLSSVALTLPLPPRISHCLEYSRLTKQDLRSGGAILCCALFQNCVGYSVVLLLHINFGICLSVFSKYYEAEGFSYTVEFDLLIHYANFFI